jgi:hypothetical protein
MVRIECRVPKRIDCGVRILCLADFEDGRATDTVSIRGYDGVLMNIRSAGELTR